MARNKINPSKIPVSLSMEEITEIIYNATRDMTIRVWASIIGAMIDFSDTTSDSIIDMVYAVNSYTVDHKEKDHAKAVNLAIRQIEDISGLDFQLTDMKIPVIRTLRDKKKFQAIADRNAVNIAFATIMEPLLQCHLIDMEKLPAVIRKAYAICQEIEGGELTLSDIAWALENEYSISMEVVNHHLCFSKKA